MADVVSAAVRSRMMAGIRAKHTQPELQVRKGLHRLGFRFRLHNSDLPGRPDIVLRRHGALIFVHGCFWHGHNCHLFKWPSSRADFWREKIERNRVVDRKALEALRQKGWRIGVIWECSLKGKTKRPLDEVLQRCESWLRSDVREFEIRGGDEAGPAV